MYSWVRQLLPGPVPLRVTLAVVLATAVVAALTGIVFPWVDHHLAPDIHQPLESSDAGRRRARASASSRDPVRGGRAGCTRCR